MRKLLPYILIVLVVIAGGIYLNNSGVDMNESIPVPSNSEEVGILASTTVPTPNPSPTNYIYEGISPNGYKGFFELKPIIGGQQAYIAVPTEIPFDKPARIIIYYHGSTQNITTNFNDQVMKNMRKYGSFMTEQNYIFIASNQHGDNWGSEQAVYDSTSAIKWVRERYPVDDKIMVLGFSMGGMPAMKHVLMYPNSIQKIALLAPANQVEYFSVNDFNIYKRVPLEIWHGTADVNVPYWATELLVDLFEKNNAPVKVHTLKNKTHWDVDTEYMDEVLNFYNSEK